MPEPCPPGWGSCRGRGMRRPRNYRPRAWPDSRPRPDRPGSTCCARGEILLNLPSRVSFLHSGGAMARRPGTCRAMDRRARATWSWTCPRLGVKFWVESRCQPHGYRSSKARTGFGRRSAAPDGPSGRGPGAHEHRRVLAAGRAAGEAAADSRDRATRRMAAASVSMSTGSRSSTRRRRNGRRWRTASSSSASTGPPIGSSTACAPTSHPLRRLA